MNLGGRYLRVLWLGRAHTDGDPFIHLPDQRVLITGDTVIGWMPFLDDGFPDEWIRTLRAAEHLDCAHLIMGHGDTASRDHLGMFRRYLEDLLAIVTSAYEDGLELQVIQDRARAGLAPRYECWMSRYREEGFLARIDANVASVRCFLSSTQ